MGVLLWSTITANALSAAEDVAETEPGLPPYSVKYDPKRDPFADGRAALLLARETHRRVLIEIGGEWCAWCHRLDRFLRDHPDVRQALFDTFVLLKVNVSDENRNEAFLEPFPKVLGYPHMYVTDSDGKVLHSKDTAELLENKQYSVRQFMRFINRWRVK